MNRQRINTVEETQQLPYGTVLRQLDCGYALGLWWVNDEGAIELGWTEMGDYVKFKDYDGGPGDAERCLPAEVLYRHDEGDAS